MVSILLANYLERELERHDAQLNGTSDDAGTFFPMVSRQMNKKDFDKFVKTLKRRLKKLKRESNDCPSRIWDWEKHYLG